MNMLSLAVIKEKVSNWFKRNENKDYMKTYGFEKRVIIEEYGKAVNDLKVAELHFQSCDEDYMELANENLTIARKKVDIAILKYKLLQKQREQSKKLLA
jgi:hypothetical protein